MKLGLVDIVRQNQAHKLQLVCVRSFSKSHLWLAESKL